MSKTVIIADGSFPTDKVPLGYLRDAGMIVCCDGSAQSLLDFGMTPDAIVGDMDSLSRELAEKFSDRIHEDKDQETNDLTKAVQWCYKSGYDDIAILGATGKREDHTIGNISLLAEYSEYLNVKMITDTGIFLPLRKSGRIETFPGQQVSIFSINPETEITVSGLRYPLIRRKLRNWWMATLNEALGHSVELTIDGGPVLIFLKFHEGGRA